MKTILLSGRQRLIMEQLVAKLERHDYKVIPCLSDSETIMAIQNRDFDAVLIGMGVEDNSRRFLTDAVKAKDPDIKLIQHRGRTYGLIEDVEAALGKNNEDDGEK